MTRNIRARIESLEEEKPDSNSGIHVVYEKPEGTYIDFYTGERLSKPQDGDGIVINYGEPG